MQYDFPSRARVAVVQDGAGIMVVEAYGNV